MQARHQIDVFFLHDTIFAETPVCSAAGEDDIVLGPTARGAPHLPYLGTESDRQGSSPAHWQVSVGLVL